MMTASSGTMDCKHHHPPSSTKNQQDKRDLEMRQTPNGKLNCVLVRPLMLRHNAYEGHHAPAGDDRFRLILCSPK